MPTLIHFLIDRRREIRDPKPCRFEGQGRVTRNRQYLGSCDVPPSMLIYETKEGDFRFLFRFAQRRGVRKL